MNFRINKIEKTIPSAAIKAVGWKANLEENASSKSQWRVIEIVISIREKQSDDGPV